MAQFRKGDCAKEGEGSMDRTSVVCIVLGVWLALFLAHGAYLNGPAYGQPPQSSVSPVYGTDVRTIHGADCRNFDCTRCKIISWQTLGGGRGCWAGKCNTAGPTFYACTLQESVYGAYCLEKTTFSDATCGPTCTWWYCGTMEEGQCQACTCYDPTKPGDSTSWPVWSRYYQCAV